MINGISSSLPITSMAPSTLAKGVTTDTSGSSADFGQVLGSMVNRAIGTIQTGEAAAIQGLSGATPAYKVIESVMEAQRTLQSAIAVRDKAVSAFQEITRMAI